MEVFGDCEISSATIHADETTVTCANDKNEGIVEFGADFLSKVCVDAVNASHIDPIKASSPGSSSETCTETASTCSTRNHDDIFLSESTSYEEDDDCSIQSTASTNSNKSISSMNSTQLLLKQAHARMHRQSIYEEVKHLRTLLSGHETHSKLLERQKSNLDTKYKELGSAYTTALEHIHKSKLKEQQIKEEQAERELEYMNQMNEVCRHYDTKEKNYMDQLIEKDAIIEKLQNRLKEMECDVRKGM